jgi:hypothetical protein
MKNLMKLCSNHPDPIHAANDWRKDAKGTLFCPRCSRIYRRLYPKPINVVLKRHPGNRISAGVWCTGIRIFHSDFLEQIKDYLQDFILGKCYDANGKLIEDFMTCYHKKYLVIRGVAGSTYTICPACNEVGPIPGDFPHYIPRFYLTDSKIYQNSSCSMLLDEELVKQLDVSYWPDAEFDTIPIRDNPIDGQVLPIDPGYVKPSDSNSALASESDSENLTE